MDAKMKHFLENFVKKDKLGGGAQRPPRSQAPGFMKMAEFVSDTLSKVLSKDQMYELVQNNNDPKFFTTPLTSNQRAKISSIVLSNILRPSQLKELSDQGGVSTDTLDATQTQIIADLSAGYMLGKTLKANQFSDYINRKPIALGLQSMNILRAGGICRIPQLEKRSVYMGMRKRDSKYMMEMGRYMSEPATNFLRASSGKTGALSGGASSLLQLKSKIDFLGF